MNCQGIPIQQINITAGTVFIGNTGSAVSIGVLGTIDNLQPTYMQVFSTVPATLELHTGTPASTVSSNRVCLIAGLGTINGVWQTFPVNFGGVSKTLSVRVATPTAVTAGTLLINFWK